MKYKLFITLLVTSIISANAFALEAKFSDAAWNGIKVPAGQQCLRFGGNNPSTPKIKLSGIPAGSIAIVMEFSDRDYKSMDKGGHGKIKFMLNSPVNEITIPSVPGHTFDLPSGFKMIAAHRSPGWDKAGAYMPPCSGGKGHAYYVTIKAIKNNKVAATTILEMGKY